MGSHFFDLRLQQILLEAGKASRSLNGLIKVILITCDLCKTHNKVCNKS